MCYGGPSETTVFIMLYICSWKTGEHLHVLIAVSIMVGCCGWGGTGLVWQVNLCRILVLYC